MSQSPPADRHALVVGATGIAGQALCHELVERGWPVSGVSTSVRRRHRRRRLRSGRRHRS